MALDSEKSDIGEKGGVTFWTFRQGFITDQFIFSYFETIFGGHPARKKIR